MADAGWLGFMVALGIGLLIGVERERRKGEGPERAAAGLRTFSTVSLLGAVAARLDALVLAAAALGVSAYCAASVYSRRGEDPGLTTEAALLLTLLLGALSCSEPSLAAALAVILAVLLAEKTRLHHFVRSAITEREVGDVLVLAAATLVILPLVPDRYLGPLDAFNPHASWMLVVLILLAGAAGQVACRLLGPRYGLPAAGFASGFVSSVATVAAMGARVRSDPLMLRPAAAAALFSSVATFVQLPLILAVISPAVLREAGIALALGLCVSAAFALVYTLHGRGERGTPDPEGRSQGRAISLQAALLLALALSSILMLSALLEHWLGRQGVWLAALLAGFADVHATVASAASLAAAGHISPRDAVLPFLLALSANTGSKLVAAAAAGGRRFALAVGPGLLLALAAAWSALLI